MAKESQSELDNFNDLMRKLVKVPHSEVKAKLDAEKKANANKPKRGPKPKK